MKHIILTVLLYLICLGNVQATFEIQRWITNKNVPVYYVHRPELPMVDISLVFDAGSARDGKQYGLANLTSRMLVHGAGGLSADQIMAHFDSIGARYGTSTSRDTNTIRMRTLTEHLQKSIAMLNTIVSSPDFTNEALAQLKTRTLTTIHKQKQEPRTIAGITLYKALYGDHPYAHPRIGEEQTIKTITQDQVKDFHRRYFVNSNLQLAIVGDISKNQAQALATDITNKLVIGAPAPLIPPVKLQTVARKIHVPFDSNQAHVYVAQLALGYNDPDYFPLYVANHIFGGSGFGSRLLEEVRVKHGYAYSAWSYLLPQRLYGPFIIGFQTHTDQADSATTLVYQLLKEYIRNGPKKEELELSKDHIRGSFPLRISSNKQISNWVQRTAIEQLDLNYTNTFTSKTDQVTREEIINTLQKRIHPDKMLTITVGG